MSRVSWDIIIAKIFEDTTASGIVVVLESESKEYIYHVENGEASFM